MRRAPWARLFSCALTLGLLGSACTLTSDLDRLKTEADSGIPPADAPDEKPALCEKGVDCSGCAACESFCSCAAAPTAYESCVAQCYDAGP